MKIKKLDPTKWKITNNIMMPKYTDLPYAPEELLEITPAIVKQVIQVCNAPTRKMV